MTILRGEEEAVPDLAVEPRSGAVIQQDTAALGWMRLPQGSGPEVRVVGTDGEEILGWVDATEPVGLPVGGPYAVEVGGRERGEIVATDLYVGDIWVLAGQSNMAGCGRLREGLPAAHDAVRAMDAGGRWSEASEPLAGRGDALDRYLSTVDPNGVSYSPTQRAALARTWLPRVVGPAVAFGQAVHESLGLPIGLVPTALGGTPIADWRPRGDEDPGPCYARMLDIVASAGGVVRGVLWYQGESDANQSAGTGYLDAAASLLAGFRRDLRTHSPRLPVYVVQISRMAGIGAGHAANAGWSTVREVQRNVAALGADGMVSAIDLQLDDIVHVDTEGVFRVGRRLARLALGQSDTLNLKSVTVDEAGTEVELVYQGVTGRLSPHRNIAGFSVHQANYSNVPIIHRSGIDDDQGNIVRLRLARPPQPGEALCYGWGANPVCNLVDDADMAAPAFGPIPLVTP